MLNHRGSCFWKLLRIVAYGRFSEKLLFVPVVVFRVGSRPKLPFECRSWHFDNKQKKWKSMSSNEPTLNLMKTEPSRKRFVGKGSETNLINQIGKFRFVVYRETSFWIHPKYVPRTEFSIRPPMPKGKGS